MCAPSGTSAGRERRAELGCGLVSRPNGAYTHVLVAEVLEPVREGAGHEYPCELRRERLLVVVELALAEIATLDELAQPPEELRFERADREVPAVGRGVEAVAREAAREHPWDRLASQPVCDEVVGAVCHRDDEAGAESGSLALEQRSEHLRHRAERPGREIRDLQRRQLGRGVLERSGPAEIVDVVTGALLVPAAEPEPGDRAVDGAVGHVVRSHPEPGGDARSEAFQHDVGAGAEHLREGSVVRQVTDDGLAAFAQRGVPRRCRRPHRVAGGRLDANDARAEARELAGRVRPGEIAREVDDQRSGERLHAGGA